MGISFKVSKAGRRFRPNPALFNTAVLHADAEESSDASIAASKTKTDAIPLSTRKLGEARENMEIAKLEFYCIPSFPDLEVSFTLKLFPDGFSIQKPVENESADQTSIDVPKFLHPYDRASETLFLAIESGRLPGDILDDIPCIYSDGAIICEVQDYRKCFPGGVNVASVGSSPVINRVSLKMSLENKVKDIPAISENGWTYGDLMEVESRILKAIQPQLCLEPTPQLDRLSENPVQNKLNLEQLSTWMKKSRQIPEVVVSTNNHGKKVCLERVLESSWLGDAGTLVLASHQTNYIGVGSPRIAKYQPSGSLLSASLGSPGGKAMMIPYTDNVAASIHGKSDSQDVQSSPLTNKKARLMHTGTEGIQHLGLHMDTLHGSELHSKNTSMRQQSIGGGIQYANNGMQKFTPQLFEGGPMPFKLRQGIRYNFEEEPVERDRLEKTNVGCVAMGETVLINIDPQQLSRFQQRMPHQMMRPSFPQSPRNSLGQPLDNSSRKEDHFKKRKSVQIPHVSAGGLPQSQKEKPAVSSVPTLGVGGNPSFTSSANDSMQRQKKAWAAAKRRSKSLPKTPVVRGVGSLASVGNTSIPINASSPPLDDHNFLEGIEMVAMSDNLKSDTCKMPSSKSPVDGNVNVCKTRILNFVQTERVLQGNSFQFVPKSRTSMIMSEKPNDGSVAIHIGEIEDVEYLAAEDYLPTLPNTMTREGDLLEDLVQPKPVQMNPALEPQPNTPGIPPASAAPEMQQFSEGVSLQPSSDVAKPSNSGDARIASSENIQVGSRMLPTGSTPAMQMSQGLMHGVSVALRPQPPELPPLQQQPQQPQQQHPQFQRSPLMLPTNSMQDLNNIAQNANMQLGNHMTNKALALQLQLLQLQKQSHVQPQQQATMKGEMMPGLGNVGMGIEGAWDLGGSAPMGSMSNIGNVKQNAMNLSSALNCTNALCPHHAAYMKLKMGSQNRSNIVGNPQSTIGGIPGARQMHPGSGISILGPSLNRANMNQMQLTAMGSPNTLPGERNVYMNQQQQLHLRLQQQQQETTSLLQPVMSPPQSSRMGIPHQMNQPLQQRQLLQAQLQEGSPQQLSSGAIHPIANSPIPMELQGATKK